MSVMSVAYVLLEKTIFQIIKEFTVVKNNFLATRVTDNSNKNLLCINIPRFATIHNKYT